MTRLVNIQLLDNVCLDYRIFVEENGEGSYEDPISKEFKERTQMVVEIWEEQDKQCNIMFKDSATAWLQKKDFHIIQQLKYSEYEWTA